MKKQKAPKEDPSVISLRERQVRELAELDEEENRRIKSSLVPRVGAFRRRSGDASGSSGRPARGGGPVSSVRSSGGKTGQRAFTAKR